MLRSKISILVFLLFSMGSLRVYSQISEGGEPYSSNNYIKQDVPYVMLDKPEITQQDELSSLNPPEIGRAIPVYYTLRNTGSWYEADAGIMIWRLGIKVEGAKSIGLNYSVFRLSDDARLFIYDSEREYTIGAFTYRNNSQDKEFATELLPGDDIILELECPPDQINENIIAISEVAYIYRYSPFSNQRDFGDSGPCEVNVNCPEGKEWIDQKRGVARILLKQGNAYYWCTGSLINNVRNDTTPYFLTANHCGVNASVSDYNKWIFYFNFEFVSCQDQVSSPGSRTITGSAKVAEGTDSPANGSDFKLLLLNTKVPKEYQPYYNGWNRENIVSSYGVCIHHPRGDVKKISTYTQPLISTDWTGVTHDMSKKYWKTTWSATQSGHGVTEPGSSGSPLFDANKRIIGQLTGGASSCEELGYPDYFGKLWFSWESNPYPLGGGNKLLPFLDPDYTGALAIDGLDYGLLQADFYSDVEEVFVGDHVSFSDSTRGEPDAYSWTFNGGDPSFLDYNMNNIPAEVKVKYDQPGNYTVSLIVSKDIQSALIQDEKTKKAFIKVRPRLYPNPYNPDNVKKEAFTIYFGNTSGILELDIISIYGEKLKSIRYELVNGKAELYLDDIRSGKYILKYKLNGLQYDSEVLIVI